MPRAKNADVEGGWGPRTRRLGDDRDYARGPRGPRRLGDDRRLLVRAHGSSSIRATRVLSGATPDHRGYPYPANPGAAKRVRHGCPSLATLKDYKLRESWGSGPPEWYKMKAQLWGGGSLPIGREHFIGDHYGEEQRSCSSGWRVSSSDDRLLSHIARCPVIPLILDFDPYSHTRYLIVFASCGSCCILIQESRVNILQHKKSGVCGSAIRSRSPGSISSQNQA